MNLHLVGLVSFLWVQSVFADEGRHVSPREEVERSSRDDTRTHLPLLHSLDPGLPPPVSSHEEGN
jgi:hypothetical protein